jgi:hypothetical protein
MLLDSRGREARMEPRARQVSLDYLLRQADIARRAADLVAPQRATRLIRYAEECESEL